MNVLAFNTAQLTQSTGDICSLSLYLMRFANTVVIVAFERLRFLSDLFREKYFSLIK